MRRAKSLGAVAAILSLPFLLGGCALVIRALTVDFTATPTVGAAALEVQFTELVTVEPSHAPYRVEWDFGDGTTSTEHNPTHTYSQPGLYTVTLTVTAGTGNLKQTVTETKVDYIQVASPGGYVPPPPAGTGNAADINAAVDNAGPGGLILVEAGTYTGNLIVDQDGVTIKAVSGEMPVVEGNLVVDADNVIIENFKFTDDLETTPFASFTNLTLSNTVLYGQTFDTALSCDDVVNEGELIQDSIDSAAGGETICVGSGTYVEAVKVDKPLLLLGLAQPVIKPDNSTPLHDSGVRRVAVYVDSADNVTVEGFEIDGTGGDVHIGLYFFNSNNSAAKRNVVHDMKNEIGSPVSDVAGLGILFFGWGQGIEGALVEDNVVYNSGRMGIFIGGLDSTGWPYLISSGNVIRNNVVYSAWQGPTNDWGGAIQMNAPKDSLIEGNTVHDTGLNMPGIYLFGSVGESSNLIQGNNIYNNNFGIVTWTDVSSIGGVALDGNSFGAPEIHRNNIYSNTAKGLSNADTNPTYMVNAENNWWGDASGPNDPDGTTEVPPCTADPSSERNADGAGDKVSGNVDYCPWATAPF